MPWWVFQYKRNKNETRRRFPKKLHYLFFSITHPIIDFNSNFNSIDRSIAEEARVEISRLICILHEYRLICFQLTPSFLQFRFLKIIPSVSCTESSTLVLDSSYWYMLLDNFFISIHEKHLTSEPCFVVAISHTLTLKIFFSYPRSFSCFLSFVRGRHISSETRYVIGMHEHIPPHRSDYRYLLFAFHFFHILLRFLFFCFSILLFEGFAVSVLFFSRFSSEYRSESNEGTAHSLSLHLTLPHFSFNKKILFI